MSPDTKSLTATELKAKIAQAESEGCEGVADLLRYSLKIVLQVEAEGDFVNS